MFQLHKAIIVNILSPMILITQETNLLHQSMYSNSYDTTEQSPSW
jgi:hypothetical protein